MFEIKKITGNADVRGNKTNTDSILKTDSIGGDFIGYDNVMNARESDGLAARKSVSRRRFVLGFVGALIVGTVTVIGTIVLATESALNIHDRMAKSSKE